MKKNFFYALMSAIALTGAIGFTACSSNDDVVVENNPTYDGNNVRTDFAFSISSGAMGTTRMAGTVTQESGNFNGMKEMYLFPFTNQPSTSNKTTNVGINNYPLGTLTGITAAASSKVYSLQIPVGTTDFLFYAKSNPDATITTTDALPLKTRRGSLSSSLDEDVNNIDNIYFSLDKILTTADLGNDATKMAEYLTYIAQAEVASSADASVTIHWYEAPDKAETIGAYSPLATMYTKFTTIDNYTVRAGSAEAVRRMVFDLYVTAKAIVAPAAGDADVVALANEICNRIENGKSGGCKISIDDSATDPKDWTSTAWVTSSEGAEYTPNEKFPHNLLLPMGAAQLTCTQDLTANPVAPPTFSYKDPVWYELHQSSTSLTGSGVSLNNICYPAELIYFDNSPLRATNSYKATGDYPKTVSAWDAAFANPTTGDWKGQRVEPSTRAVAMQNNVNYGVAMLKTTVKLEDGDASADGIQLYDNQQALAGGSTDKTVTLNASTNTFKVTGILIGGQPKSVGWNMTNPGLPTVTSNTNGKEVFDHVIYDQDITFAANALGTSVSAANYTLVLDNYTTESQQKPVRFALELVNNSGVDFYGLDGIIPAGQTFYLCGVLDPNATTGVAEWNKATRPGTSYRVTQEAVKRVFIQDYQTVANVTIKQDAIKKAYSTIPDLRATEVLFGLSVDLTWEAGLNFTVDLE